MRQQCQAGLNKSEARLRWHRPYSSINKVASPIGPCRTRNTGRPGLNLVIAAIALWNTLYMERAVDHLRARDVAAPDALLAHLSPMGWAQFSLTGDYLERGPSAVAAGGFSGH